MSETEIKALLIIDCYFSKADVMLVQMQHRPVLASEVIEELNITAGKTYIDGTLGAAGHSSLILQSLTQTGRLISFDQDPQMIKLAESESSEHHNWQLVCKNFAEIYTYCKEQKIKIDGGIILDLGLNSIQLDSDNRGFNFVSESKLDMRMNQEQEFTAHDIVNQYKETELANLIYSYGEERKSRQIAKAIIGSRPIQSCKQLAELIKKLYARSAQGKTFRIHPATKTFQALRIEVNQELDVLETILDLDFEVLEAGARVCIISFHSLEDRLVKNKFRELAKEGKLKLINKKPTTPSNEEIVDNPRSRSAKLRVAEILT